MEEPLKTMNGIDITYYIGQSLQPKVIEKSFPSFQVNTQPTGEFPDIPPHEQYLTKCTMLDDICYINHAAIITEKYSDHAIVYLTAPVHRPAVIFRCCISNYDKLKLGDWVQVATCFLQMPNGFTGKKFFTLYCIEVEPLIVPEYESEVHDDIRVYLNNVCIPICPTLPKKECKKGLVVYSPFGAILVEEKYAKNFDLQQGQIICTLRSILRSVDRNEFCCWTLCSSFAVFRKSKLFRHCKDGVYQTIPKPKEPPKEKKFRKPLILTVPNVFERTSHDGKFPKLSKQIQSENQNADAPEDDEVLEIEDSMNSKEAEEENKPSSLFPQPQIQRPEVTPAYRQNAQKLCDIFFGNQRWRRRK